MRINILCTIVILLLFSLKNASSKALKCDTRLVCHSNGQAYESFHDLVLLRRLTQVLKTLPLSEYHVLVYFALPEHSSASQQRLRMNSPITSRRFVFIPFLVAAAGKAAAAALAATKAAAVAAAAAKAAAAAAAAKVAAAAVTAKAVASTSTAVSAAVGAAKTAVVTAATKVISATEALALASSAITVITFVQDKVSSIGKTIVTGVVPDGKVVPALDLPIENPKVDKVVEGVKLTEENIEEITDIVKSADEEVKRLKDKLGQVENQVEAM